MNTSMISMDTVRNEWKEILRSYPPLLTPKQVQDASLGIIKAGDVYKRGSRDAKRIDLDCRTIGGKIFVTKESLVLALSGKPELPL